MIKKTAESFIKSLSFIFDKTKKYDSISYAVFYSMQYVFWQVVVIGGLLTNKPLSAKLLTNSLSAFGKEPSNLLIEGEWIKRKLFESEMFRNKIEQLVQKYGVEKQEFSVNENSEAEDVSIQFDNSDLLYALHKAIKEENNKWSLDIEIRDTYDFTEFKNLKEYTDSKDAIIDDILSTTLNNLAVVSSEYGVIKTYDVIIRVEAKEGEF